MYNHLRGLFNYKDGVDNRPNYLSKNTLDDVKYCFNKMDICKFTSNMDISTFQMLPISLNLGSYMLKSGVVVKWPEDMLGYPIMGEICYVTE